MSNGPLQELVDALAERLQRSVTVEDQSLQLLAFSRHYGDADPARIWSLLNRRSRPDDVDYPMLRQADGPVRLAAAPDIELLARLCLPVRAQGMLLGFLWLIDRDHTLTDPQISDAVNTTAVIARVLRRRLILREDETTLASHLLGQLLAPDRSARSTAMADVLAGGFIGEDAYVGVVRVSLQVEPEDSTLIGQAVGDATRHLPPNTWIARTGTRTSTVLLARGTPLPAALDWLARALAKNLAGQPNLRIGVSGVGQSLADVPVVSRQAEIALTLADTPAGFGSLTRWADLGPYQLIGQLSASVIDNELLSPGLFRLLRAGKPNDLVATAEAFLDCNGDKQQAAQRLDVHRSTLYYRLDRIAAITGLDLSSGSDRLLLHLAIKLSHLAPLGRYPDQESGPRPIIERYQG